jgi:LmbE family N-acetylglucosaminyl deacetylase
VVARRGGRVKIFLSPHNDDESLFGAFTLIREKPLVVVCLRSETQASRGDGITFERRERETACAMNVLGCEWTQWPVGDLEPDWAEVHERLENLDALWHPEEVYAPLWEANGHLQHNVVANLAREVFGDERVTPYLTYTTRGKSKNGTPVDYEPQWVAKKLVALSCYESQVGHPLQAEHFLRSWREFYA